jgi:hypothetical protein
MSDLMLERGVFVTGFGFPVVPKGEARVRCQVSAAHTRDDLDAVVAAFLAEHTGSSEPGILAGLKSALRKRFAAGYSRHQSTVSVLAGAMKEARLGLYPAQIEPHRVSCTLGYWCASVSAAACSA